MTKVDVLRETLEIAVRIIGRADEILDLCESNPYPMAMGRSVRADITNFRKHLDAVFTPENIQGD